MFRILLICFMLLPALTQAGCHASSTATPTRTQLKKEPTVVLYSAPWCYWCKQSKDFMDDNDIKYVERSVEEPSNLVEIQKHAKKLKYKGSTQVVPLFVIGDEMFPGYRPLKILHALGRVSGRNKAFLRLERTHAPSRPYTDPVLLLDVIRPKPDSNQNGGFKTIGPASRGGN